MEEQTLATIRALIASRDICVLATTNGEEPHTSLMAYAAETDGTVLYLVTRKASRKYLNILTVPRVSLLIDTRDEHLTEDRASMLALSVNGTAEPITDSTVAGPCMERFLDRHPDMEGFVSREDSVFLRIRAESFLLLRGPESARHVKLEKT
ncbi:pyridoxamine 5'-phosphate oxidase family protein [Pseudodesulfovibrio tunisiensis]|uniref:pyridoxamine 5'-phosphate oxidase family protein n=1 Tax=Pseudodesulfovibrio tunisiensis TaxID=463192 RepID=UPI001FB5389D|nr:pyridoxamine 5'-phosphate oxidase family protein [Pseudodesulfovibrio tunisiensis]